VVLKYREFLVNVAFTQQRSQLYLNPHLIHGSLGPPVRSGLA